MLNGRLKVLSIHAPDHHEGLAVSENILHLLKEIVLTLQALLSIWDEKTLSTMNSRSMLYQEFGLNLGTLGIISYIRNYENFDFSLDSKDVIDKDREPTYTTHKVQVRRTTGMLARTFPTRTFLAGL